MLKNLGNVEAGTICLGCGVVVELLMMLWMGGRWAEGCCGRNGCTLAGEERIAGEKGCWRCAGGLGRKGATWGARRSNREALGKQQEQWGSQPEQMEQLEQLNWIGIGFIGWRKQWQPLDGIWDCGWLAKMKAEVEAVGWCC